MIVLQLSLLEPIPVKYGAYILGEVPRNRAQDSTFG